MNPETMVSGQLNRLRQRNSLGPSRDGQNYAVVHCTGYIKNWPPTGKYQLTTTITMLLPREDPFVGLAEEGSKLSAVCL